MCEEYLALFNAIVPPVHDTMTTLNVGEPQPESISVVTNEEHVKEVARKNRLSM